MTAAWLLVSLFAALPASAQGEWDFSSLKSLKEAVQEGREKLAEPRRRRPARPKPRVRLPSWEIAAVRSGEDFSRAGSPLTEAEILDARKIFGDSLDYAKVRVVSAVTTTKTPNAWGNVIRVPAGARFTRPVLIHELTHVWQYQTQGTGYISDSLLAQACAFLTEGDRDEAYKYKLVPGKRFVEYSAEQQGKILEVYRADPKLRDHPEYQRLVAEVRSARPLRGHEDLVLEAAGGLGPRRNDLPRPEVFDPPREGRGVPQLEFRW